MKGVVRKTWSVERGASGFLLFAIILAGWPGTVRAAEGLHPTARAQEGRFVTTIRTTGLIKPLKEISIRAAFSGTITYMWPNGSHVPKGETILEIDSERLDEKITERTDKMNLERAEQTKAEQYSLKRRARAKLNLLRAQERVKIAALKLELVKDGASEDEIA